MKYALAILTLHRDTNLHNAPIQDKEGRAADAELSRATAADCSAALERLDRWNGQAPSVTAQQIEEILEGSEVSIQTIFEKVTLVSVRLPSGFVLTASSGAVSKENYSESIGAEVCLRQIKDQVWKLEGYHLQRCVAG